MKSVFDREAARELELYLMNDSEIYFRSFLPISKNLEKKMGKGIFDQGKAAKAFMYCTEFAAKKYCKEFGGIWYQVFSKATRENVAETLVENFTSDH